MTARRATTSRPMVLALVLTTLALMLSSVTEPARAAIAGDPDVALFNPNNGQWHLRYGDGSILTFFYGVPGDTPLMGDWDCDGTDTVAMYRESSGFIYYRNSNDFGVADGDFFFGIPGDIPIAGDWNNNGCDTFGIYRNAKVFLRNSLDTGIADVEYFFGVPGDRPFAGDFDGVGGSTVGLYRQTSGLVYFRNSLTTGVADFEFFYGIPSDRIVPGDWDLDGDDTVGIYRPTDQTFYLSLNNVQGPADITVSFGQGSWLPTAGDMASPTVGDRLNIFGGAVPPPDEPFHVAHGFDFTPGSDDDPGNWDFVLHVDGVEIAESGTLVTSTEEPPIDARKLYNFPDGMSGIVHFEGFWSGDGPGCLAQCLFQERFVDFGP